MCKKYKVATRVIGFLLFYYKIEGRSYSEADKLVNNEKRETCLKLYGVDNPSKAEEIKAKKRNTFIIHYGVDNVRKSPEFYKYVNKIFLQKYGMTSSEWHRTDGIKKWKLLSEEDKNNLSRKRMKGLINHSKLESKFAAILTAINLSYVRQFYINGKPFDFILPDFNIIIETNGDYWHANPKIYNENDIITFPKQRKALAKDVWKADKDKENLAIDRGYKVLYFWENDINKLSDIDLTKFVLNTISNFVGDK